MITVKRSVHGTLIAQVVVPEIGRAYNDKTDEDHVYATLAFLCVEAEMDLGFYGAKRN